MGFPSESIWNNPTALVAYYVNNPVSMRPQAGIVVLSIIVSILGSYTALLLLGRRTSAHGWRNHGFLALAGLVFASVAVWGMHFVSMISIRLRPSPDYTWYLEFSSGMTAMSLFVPLVATIFAFWFIGDEEHNPDPQASWAESLSPASLLASWRIVVGGIFVGLTIGLMHYSASFRLPFLNVGYKPITVVFALILACVSAVAALALFFRARAQWQESFWKRGLCAIFLATAVCGMHYLGLGGTSYYTKAGVDPNDLLSGNDQATKLTIAIAVMCGSIIILSVLLALLDWRTRQQLREKKKHIVIASLAFDEVGKLLVKPDGTIPMQVMRVDDVHKNINAEFNPHSSMYQWLFQLSFCWSAAVSPLASRISQNAAAREKRGGEQISIDVGANQDVRQFRANFIEAVVQLAHSIDLSVDSIGVLFDRVLQTGTRTGPVEEEDKVQSDEEASVHGISLRFQGTSEGVMCFIVREVGKGKPSVVDFPNKEQPAALPKETIDQYLNRGWRLAEPRFFSRILAESMGVSKMEVDSFLTGCKTYAKRGTSTVVQPEGVYLGLFGVRPTSPKEGSLDVLVYNFARHQIPAYRLPDVVGPLNSRCHEFISASGGLTMHELLIKCNDTLRIAEQDGASDISRDDEDDHLYNLVAAIAVSIESLTTACRCWPDLPHLAQLYPQILEFPGSAQDDRTPAAMIVLHTVLPAPELHLMPTPSGAQMLNSPKSREWERPPVPFVYSPWSLFARAQTMVLKGNMFRDIARGYSSELQRMYPVHAVDLAVEVATEKGSNPFSDSLTARSARSNNSDGSTAHVRSLSSAGSGEMEKDGYFESNNLSSTNVNLALESASPQNKNRKRPLTATEATGVLKGALNSLGLRTRTAADETFQMSPAGLPRYHNVRVKADGWHIRLMRSLEDGQRGAELDGSDWVSQSRLLPIT